MSVLEKLEEALAKFPMSEYPNIYTNYLKDVIKPAFVAFKKDYDSKIHMPRKKLEAEITKLDEILTSDIMIMVCKHNPKFRDRWEGQKQVFNELLGVEK